MPLHVLFQSQASTWVPHMKESKVPGGIRTQSDEGKWFYVNNSNHSTTDALNFLDIILGGIFSIS